MTTVRYQAAAEADLIEVWLKIADDGGLKRADKYILKLEKTCVLLSVELNLGIARGDIELGIRSFPVDRYAIYYELNGSILSVLRV